MRTKTSHTAVPKIILLIEDELTIRNYLFNLLLDKYEESLHVLQAESVKTAVEILTSYKVDFVISDFNMPDGSGLTIYSHLKKTKQFPNLIFFSGTKELLKYLPQMEPFFKGVIKKPNFSAVLEIVGDWIS